MNLSSRTFCPWFSQCLRYVVLGAGSSGWFLSDRLRLTSWASTDWKFTRDVETKWSSSESRTSRSVTNRLEYNTRGPSVTSSELEGKRRCHPRPSLFLLSFQNGYPLGGGLSLPPRLSSSHDDRLFVLPWTEGVHLSFSRCFPHFSVVSYVLFRLKLSVLFCLFQHPLVKPSPYLCCDLYKPTSSRYPSDILYV